jgi:hypothetical protein
MTPSSDIHTDGNGVAGILQQFLLVEATATERVCQSCGSRRALGAHRGYRGAGVVLRCPDCSDVALSVVERPDGQIVHFEGTWIFRS